MLLKRKFYHQNVLKVSKSKYSKCRISFSQYYIIIEHYYSVLSTNTSTREHIILQFVNVEPMLYTFVDQYCNISYQHHVLYMKTISSRNVMEQKYTFAYTEHSQVKTCQNSTQIQYLRKYTSYLPPLHECSNPHTIKLPLKMKRSPAVFPQITRHP